MSLKIENFKSLFKGEYSFADVIDYWRGMYRYRIFYTRFNSLIRKHIREQIEFRVEMMDSDCYFNGSCKLCGCLTTALQMANKSCEKPCYPTMMNKEEWKLFKMGEYYIDYKNNVKWKQVNGILIKSILS